MLRSVKIWVEALFEVGEPLRGSLVQSKICVDNLEDNRADSAVRLSFFCAQNF